MADRVTAASRLRALTEVGVVPEGAQVDSRRRSCSWHERGLRMTLLLEPFGPRYPTETGRWSLFVSPSGILGLPSDRGGADTVVAIRPRQDQKSPRTSWVSGAAFGELVLGARQFVVDKPDMCWLRNAPSRSFTVAQRCPSHSIRARASWWWPDGGLRRSAATRGWKSDWTRCRTNGGQHPAWETDVCGVTPFRQARRRGAPRGRPLRRWRDGVSLTTGHSEVRHDIIDACDDDSVPKLTQPRGVLAVGLALTAAGASLTPFFETPTSCCSSV